MNLNCMLQVDMRMRYKQAYKAAGFQTNRKAEALITSAVIAAQAISRQLCEAPGQLRCSSTSVQHAGHERHI